MGTALTPEQARKLRRLSPSVVVCYDGDPAGRAATRGALSHLLGQGFSCRVARLPAGRDPHDVLREEGPESLVARIEEAPDYLTWLPKTRTRATRTSPPGRKQKGSRACSASSGSSPTRSCGTRNAAGWRGSPESRSSFSGIGSSPRPAGPARQRRAPGRRERNSRFRCYLTEGFLKRSGPSSRFSCGGNLSL